MLCSAFDVWTKSPKIMPAAWVRSRSHYDLIKKENDNPLDNLVREQAANPSFWKRKSTWEGRKTSPENCPDGSSDIIAAPRATIPLYTLGTFWDCIARHLKAESHRHPYNSGVPYTNQACYVRPENTHVALHAQTQVNSTPTPSQAQQTEREQDSKK